MISYKDMTFCTSDCVNVDCKRNWVHTEGAKDWWGGDDAPISCADFSGNCEDYVKGS